MFAGWAQMRVSTTFNRYNHIMTHNGLTGAEVARRILNANGLNDVEIRAVAGNLSDHYDPRTRIVNLSNEVFRSSTIGAAGVAAHEVGHAIQHQTNYTPLTLRAAIVPITNIGSTLSLPIILIGMFLSSQPLMNVGIVCFALMTVFQLVTLPVEFNASARAIKTIEAQGILQGGDEIAGAKRVLSAAALTYVAALLVSAAQLLRIMLIFGNRDKD
ncbi:MAG: zinc metallopeptidase [Oscillospiraceae bacterium]